MNWDYIAGFYEGEGTTGCYFRTKKKEWVLQVAISQKYNPILIKIKNFLKKGSICKTNTNYYIYSMSSNAARIFLNDLFPYCQSAHKIKQIKLALKIDKKYTALGQGNRLKENNKWK